MRRRDLFYLLGGAAASWPRAGAAQPAKVPLIGVLVVGSPGSDKFWRLFQEALRRLGYVEGKTVRFEFRSDRGEASRLPELAAELVRLKPDVIVTWFTPAATAAKQATGDIPIVMAPAGDPIATGLVESLARPGGNVTGISGVAAQLSGKIIEFFGDLLPAGRRLSVLVNASDPFSKPFLEHIRLAADTGGKTIDAVTIGDAAALDAAFAAMERSRPDGIIVQPSLPVARTAQLALKSRIPAACALRAFADAGGLMSYWFAEADMYGSAAVFVDKILKGAKPADLPVQQPDRFELVINLLTAKTIGVTVPQSLLARADEVIE